MKKAPFNSLPFWTMQHNDLIKKLDKLSKQLKAKIEAFDKEGASRFWLDDAAEEAVNPKLRIARR